MPWVVRRVGTGFKPALRENPPKTPSGLFRSQFADDFIHRADVGL